MKKFFPIRSNSAVIVASILERGWTAREAAAALGVGVDTMTRLLKHEQAINYRTGAKLVKVFGADAVIIATPAQA